MTDHVYDTSIPTALVTSVVRVVRVRGMTHFVFGETRPAILILEGNKEETQVVARLAVPNELVGALLSKMAIGNLEACGPQHDEPTDHMGNVVRLVQ
jgi:hypothetical protein